jgi:hypothetical protein
MVYTPTDDYEDDNDVVVEESGSVDVDPEVPTPAEVAEVPDPPYEGNCAS